MSTAMNFGTKGFKPRAPDKGAFPLDHFGRLNYRLSALYLLNNTKFCIINVRVLSYCRHKDKHCTLFHKLYFSFRDFSRLLHCNYYVFLIT